MIGLSPVTLFGISKKTNPKLAALEFWKLKRPSDIAADIGMLVEVLKSQKRSDVTILYAGTAHILNIQDIIEQDYTLLTEKDLVQNISTKTAVGSTFTYAKEEDLWPLLKEIGEKIPIIRDLMKEQDK